MGEGYSRSATAWRDGPALVYNRMAEAIVARLPSLTGKTALDLGAGAGAATLAMVRAGARVIATDLAEGMLRIDASDRPQSVVADALGLPFRADAFDVVVAAFVLNHLTDPAAALREAARITRGGGCVVASAYADDDAHPAKSAVSDAAREAGWIPAPWMDRLRAEAMPRLATVDRAGAEVARAGLHADVENVRIALPELDVEALISWRLGMADLAEFVATLDADAQASLRRRARMRLGDDVPTLVRSVIIVTVAV